VPQIAGPPTADVISHVAVLPSTIPGRRPFDAVQRRSACRPRSESPHRGNSRRPASALRAAYESFLGPVRCSGQGSRYGCRSQKAGIRDVRAVLRQSLKRARPASGCENHFPILRKATDDFAELAPCSDIKPEANCFPWWITPSHLCCASLGKRMRQRLRRILASAALVAKQPGACSPIGQPDGTYPWHRHEPPLRGAAGKTPSKWPPFCDACHETGSAARGAGQWHAPLAAAVVETGKPLLRW